MKGRKIEVYTPKDKEIKVFLNKKELQVTKLIDVQAPIPELNRKEVLCWKLRGGRPQPSSHPWKRVDHREMVKKKMKLSREAVI